MKRDCVSRKFADILGVLERIDTCESAVRTFSRLICNLLSIKENVAILLKDPDMSARILHSCHQVSIKSPEVIPILIRW